MTDETLDTFTLIPNSPVQCPPERVIEDWIDYNGHLNMAFYNVIFDHGVDHIYDHLGIGEAYAQSGVGSCFTMEAHVHYLQELSLDDPVQVTFQLLAFDHKRLHFVEVMSHGSEGFIAAISEQLGMHVDMQTRRSAPFPASTLEKLEAMRDAHQNVPPPAQIGRVMGIKQKG